MLPSKKKEYFSIPNCLSYLRIALVPLFAVLYCNGFFGWAAAVLILSGLTDVADGWIARTFSMTTDWGKIVDPLADKLTQATVSGCLILRYPHMIYLFLLVLCKESMQGIGGFLFYRKLRSMRSSEWFGKLSTAVFYGVVAFFVIFSPERGRLTDLLILISCVCTLSAWILYGIRFVRVFRSVSPHAAVPISESPSEADEIGE